MSPTQLALDPLQPLPGQPPRPSAPASAAPPPPPPSPTPTPRARAAAPAPADAARPPARRPRPGSSPTRPASSTPRGHRRPSELRRPRAPRPPPQRRPRRRRRRRVPTPPLLSAPTHSRACAAADAAGCSDRPPPIQWPAGQCRASCLTLWQLDPPVEPCCWPHPARRGAQRISLAQSHTALALHPVGLLRFWLLRQRQQAAPSTQRRALWSASVSLLLEQHRRVLRLRPAAQSTQSFSPRQWRQRKTHACAANWKTPFATAATGL